MAQKRALIVDDSRSARVILGRMLEGYALQVDSSESAELALEYLRQTKPDVIFMDHLMPGMDGFQAIQAIKSDPGTATIPVVMYTSQEGELYVSQARALGAVGVLPKTVKQADVSRVLYQLRLLPDRRDGRVATVSGGGGDSMGVEIAPTPQVSSREFETAIRTALAPALKEQSLELRRFFAAGMEAFARRLGEAQGFNKGATGTGTTTTALTTESLPPAAPPEPPPAPASRWPLAAGIVTLALVPTIVLAVLYSRIAETSKELMQSNARLASVVEEQQLQLAALQKAATAMAATAAAASQPDNPEIEPVPYGETPLAGARLEKFRDMIERLRAQGFHGKVKVVTYVGDFCLTGSGIEGYSIANDEMPYKRCDQVGNPFEDGLAPAQRQSLAFANLLSTIRQQAGEGLTIEVTHAGRRPAAPYPEGDKLAKVTAGEWNRIAAQNNRVEFGIEAAS
jgi:CheY-like chemotaxis protein